MHEISLVQEMLRQVRELAVHHKAEKITRINVEIGPLSGIVIDSFCFGFEALAAESTLTRDAELSVKTTAAIYLCSDCGHRNQTPGTCSKCGEGFLIPQGGNELILSQVEME